MKTFLTFCLRYRAIPASVTRKERRHITMNWRALSLGLAAFGALSTKAASVSYGPDNISSTQTDWTQSINFPQFDPSLGTLTQIDFSINGTLTGTAKAENTGNGSITPTLNLAATMSLSDSLGTVLAQTKPLVANTASLTAFDEAFDFGGTSGVTFSGLSQSYSTNTIATAAGDLALFKGNGSISLNYGSAGASQVLNGGGNIITQFITSSDGNASITYEYTPVEVPEASTWAVIGFVGFAGGFTYLRRRKAQA
jgi:hypothetical protein